MKRTTVLGVIALALAALFVRLGVWQLNRAEERAAINAVMSQKLAAPAVPLARAPRWPADSARLAWRRVEVAGTWEPARELVVRNRTWRGSPGVELLTPLELAGGAVLWVDRGWVPSPDASTVDPAPWRESGAARLTGWLRPSDAGERAAIGPALVLQPEPRPEVGLPRRRGGPELSAGPHLSYAVQWFAFAAIAVVGFAAYAWARARGRIGETLPEREDGSGSRDTSLARPSATRTGQPRP